MSQIRLTSSASGVITVTTPTTSANRTLTLPDNTGTVISTESTVPPKVPTFQVYLGSSQNTGTNVWNKLQLNQVHWDTDSWWDTTNYRYTPQQAGYYLFTMNLYETTAVVAHLAIYKNGTEYRRFGTSLDNSSSITSVRMVGGSVVVDLNGSTDYAEFYVYTNPNGTINNTSTRTHCGGTLIRTL
jgi:hypothetical protein